MAGGNEVAAVKVGGSRADPLSQLTSQLKQWQSGFTTWVSAQSPPVEAAIVTFTNAAQGALLGAILGTLSQDMSSLFPPNSSIDSQAMANFKKIESLAGGPAVQARNVAVITGVNAGLLCYMKRIRGAEDMEGRLVAGFGSGAMFSLVSGMGSTNKVVDAIGSGLFFAIFQAGMSKAAEKFASLRVEDVNYAKTRSLLASLGFQKYEKNFKDGLLSDQTLPFITDDALRDVRIPPGPRLLIMNQLKQHPELGAGSNE